MKRYIALSSLFICMVCFGQDQPFIDTDESSYSESTVILDESFGPGSGERSTLREIKSVEYLPIEGLLIKVSRVTQTYSGIEGDRCRSKIRALKKVNGNYSKSWEITDTSCAAELHRYFLKTIYHGCCGAEDVYSFYSLKSGELVVMGTSDPHIIPNTGGKMIVYFGENGTIFDKKKPNLNGIIYLVTEHSILDTVFVESLEDPPWTPKIIADSEKYLSSAEKDISFIYGRTYHLLVIGNSFSIPKESAVVFKKAY